MIDLLATDDCVEVMREARNSHWVSKLQRLGLNIYINQFYYDIMNHSGLLINTIFVKHFNSYIPICHTIFLCR